MPDKDIIIVIFNIEKHERHEKEAFLARFVVPETD